MTPQLEVARFLSGYTMLRPSERYVTEEGCVVDSWAHLNKFGEAVEHVTLREGKHGGGSS